MWGLTFPSQTRILNPPFGATAMPAAKPRTSCRLSPVLSWHGWCIRWCFRGYGKPTFQGNQKEAIHFCWAPQLGTCPHGSTANTNANPDRALSFLGPMSTRASGIKVVRGEESLRFCRGVSCWGKKRLRVPSDVSDGLTSAHAPGRERGEY